MKALAVISLCGLALCALPAAAQPVPLQTGAANGCWDAVTREARGMLDADRVSRNSYSTTPLANAEIMVTGNGQADGRNFTYRCTYNQRTGRAYAVTLSPEGRGPGDRDRDFGGNRPAPGGDPRRAAADACYDATLASAQRQQPTASNFKIFLSQNRYAQQSNAEILVTGQGELRQMDRLRVQWRYRCTYNARNGRVRDVSLSDFIPNR